MIGHNSPWKKSFHLKLLGIVFMSLFLLGIATNYFNYRQQMKQEQGDIDQKFSLIADLLKYNTNHWLTDRENDVTVMAANPLVRTFASQLMSGSSASTATAKALADYWQEYIDQYNIYDDIYYVNKDGLILVSTDSSRVNTYRPKDDLVNQPLQTGRLYFQDVYQSSITHKPAIAFSIPVREDAGSTGYAGVLVFRVDIASVLQPLLQSQVNLGNTGEVILINRNRTTITDLRQRPGSSLNYILNTEPALRVIRGEEGIMRGTGYEGEEIIAAYRYLPQVHWGIIVRQGSNELLAPVMAQFWRYLFMNTLIGMVVLLVVYLSLTGLLKPVKSMVGAARDIARGDFQQRLQVQSKDEIGVLAESINYMAGALGQQFKLQECRQDVLQSLVSTLHLDNLLEQVLDQVCRCFAFNVGAIFMVSPGSTGLKRLASYCPGPDLINQREMLDLNEGLEGLAFASGQVQVLRDLPKDTVYSVNWFGAALLPDSVIAVPLLFGQKALGVMSVASLGPVDEPVLQELATVGALMGVAVNNAVSYRREKDLAGRLQALNEELAQQNEEVKAQSEELLSQTEELQAQSAELQSATRELQVKNEALAKLDARKSNYLASLSHELRAPLNAVISFSDVLLDRVVGDINRQQEQYLTEILNSGEHLLGLINDLLDLSKIEAGKMTLDIQPLDPAVPLKEALAMLSTGLAEKRLLVSNLLSPQTYRVAADGSKLKQVYLNLLSNALKYTPAAGRIDISVHADGKKFYCRIADTGIGIPEEYHEAVFEEFRQVANNGYSGGTGLGLAITKKLLSLQGGTIELTSQVGQGAAFTFSLPLLPPGDGLTGPEKDDRSVSPGKPVIYLAKPLDKYKLVEYLGKKKFNPGGSSPTLLVVDDDLAVRNTVVAYLEPRGIRVLTAADGLTGIDLAVSQQPDVLILDITMPGADGFQVLDRLSKCDWRKGVSVLIATSKDLSGEEKAFLEERARKIHQKCG